MLQEVFCERYHCSASEFTNKMFWRCLYRRSWPIAWVMKRLQPDFFRNDFILLQQIACDTSLRQIEMALQDFRFLNQTHGGWLRGGLRVRLSGRHLLELSKKLLRCSKEAAGSATGAERAQTLAPEAVPLPPVS